MNRDSLQTTPVRPPRIPLGAWVLLALAASVGLGWALKRTADQVRTELFKYLEGRDPTNLAQTLNSGGVQIPQAFGYLKRKDDEERKRGERRADAKSTSELLVQALKEADKNAVTDAKPLEQAKHFHRLDLAFMASYGPLLVLGALWGRKRAKMLADSLAAGGKADAGRAFALWPARAPEGLWRFAIAAALVGVAGDLLEYYACTGILGGNFSSGLQEAAVWAGRIKWVGTIPSGIIGLAGGAWAVLATSLVRRSARPSRQSPPSFIPAA